MNEHERRLLKIARNGGIKAFEELTAPHQRIVYNYLLISCSNEFEACQLTQDVLSRFSNSSHQMPLTMTCSLVFTG